MSNSFLWGVSTSGYQHEGGYNGPSQPQNNWSLWEKTGRVETTGTAAQFWERYLEDLQRCQDMGLNAFRLSIEWARVQPTLLAQRSAPPEFDYRALNGYCDRIVACRDHGLEPIVTLQHFTHPAWRGTDAWLETATVDVYLNYVQVTVEYLNRRLVDEYGQPPLHWYITINEPNILVANTYLKGDFPGKAWGPIAGLHAYNQLLTAHVQAYNAIHDIYERENWPRPQVSLNTYCSDLYWSEKVLWDLLDSRRQGVTMANARQYLADNAALWDSTLIEADLPQMRGPIYKIGRAARRWANRLGQRMVTADAVQGILDAVAASPRPQVFDFIGLDYYDPFFAHSFRFPQWADLLKGEKTDWRGRLMAGITRQWWDWHVLPEGLFFFCKEYARAFDPCPVLIAENGMALRRDSGNSIASHRTDRLQRSEFLAAHLEQVQRLLQEGVPLSGYCHWSLTDNYEWGSYTPRFGLFAVDYANDAKRQIADHLGDSPSETYAQLIKKMRS